MFIFTPDHISNGISSEAEKIHHWIPVQLKNLTAYAQTSNYDILAVALASELEKS